jgi:hypothetical protein
MEFKKFLESDSISAKPWKGKRADVLDMWEKVQPNLPVSPKPVDPTHKGSKFREDGIRITGSPQFISSVISRLKDMLIYDKNPGTKLEVEYRQIESKNVGITPQYVFYAYVSSKPPKAKKIKRIE